MYLKGINSVPVNSGQSDIFANGIADLFRSSCGSQGDGGITLITGRAITDQIVQSCVETISRTLQSAFRRDTAVDLH